MNGLSSRQQQVYDFVRKYQNENKISPSVLEIACGLKLARSTVNTYIEIMQRKGRLTRKPGIGRSIAIIPIE